MSFTLSKQAYLHIILHAAKHQSCAINGVLLRSNKDSSIIIKEAVPLHHSHLELAPMTEAALSLIEEYCKENDLSIAGYYHGNERHDELDLAPTAVRIADKIAALYPKIFVLNIQNARLDQVATPNSPAPLMPYLKSSPSWAPAPDALEVEGVSEGTVQQEILAHLQQKKQLKLTDFDDHLDNPSS